MAEIERAGRILADHGWAVERAQPPELELVHEVWDRLLAVDIVGRKEELQAAVRPRLYDQLMEVCGLFETPPMSSTELHTTRSRLRRLWSAFLTD